MGTALCGVGDRHRTERHCLFHLATVVPTGRLTWRNSLMSSGSLSDLRTAYLPTDSIVVDDLPDGASKVLVRTARGRAIEGSLASGKATLVNVPEGTHTLEARSADGGLL